MNKFQKELAKFYKDDLKIVFPFGLEGNEISFYKASKLRKKILKDLYKRWNIFLFNNKGAIK